MWNAGPFLLITIVTSCIYIAMERTSINLSGTRCTMERLSYVMILNLKYNLQLLSSDTGHILVPKYFHTRAILNT